MSYPVRGSLVLEHHRLRSLTQINRILYIEVQQPRLRDPIDPIGIGLQSREPHPQ